MPERGTKKRWTLLPPPDADAKFRIPKEQSSNLGHMQKSHATKVLYPARKWNVKRVLCAMLSWS